MHRLICVFVVCIMIWHKQIFSWCGSDKKWWMPLITSLDCPDIIWAPSSEFVSSSIPSWQILTAHAQPFRGARDLAFSLKVPLDYLLIWASSEGFGETARMRRLAWTFAARIGYKYQIRLTRSIFEQHLNVVMQSIAHTCLWQPVFRWKGTIFFWFSNAIL